MITGLQFVTHSSSLEPMIDGLNALLEAIEAIFWTKRLEPFLTLSSSFCWTAFWFLCILTEFREFSWLSVKFTAACCVGNGVSRTGEPSKLFRTNQKPSERKKKQETSTRRKTTQGQQGSHCIMPLLQWPDHGGHLCPNFWFKHSFCAWLT